MIVHSFSAAGRQWDASGMHVYLQLVKHFTSLAVFHRRPKFSRDNYDAER